jgi:hypothetical protein
VARAQLIRYWAKAMAGIALAQLQGGFWVVAAWIAGFAIASDMGPEETPTEFYGAASGVIATLLLALALQAAWFQYESLPRPKHWFTTKLGPGGLKGTAARASNLPPADQQALRAIVLDAIAEYQTLLSRWIFRLFYGVAVLLALTAGQVVVLLALMTKRVEASPSIAFGAITAGLVGVSLVAVFGRR